MSTTELELIILQLINKLYKVCYNKCITVKPLYEECNFNCCNTEHDKHLVGYELKIELAVKEKPLHLTYFGNEENFLNFVVAELKSRRLDFVRYFKKYKVRD